MILKIKNKGAWVLYDGLTRVQFGRSGEGRVRRTVDAPTWEYRATRKSDMGERERPEDAYEYSTEEWRPDAVFFDLDAYLDTHLSDDNKVLEYVYPAWACALDQDGNERFFAFNEAFLLNDEGRTIERIR